VPWTRRDVTYLNYSIVKQEITKVHKVLHREMKAFSVHLHQSVARLLTDSDTESATFSSTECTPRPNQCTQVSLFCVDAAEVLFLKFSVFVSGKISK